jgi:hypothetical protein
VVDELVAHARRDLDRRVPGEQRLGCVRVQAAELEHAQIGRSDAMHTLVSCRQQQCDPLGIETACDEEKRVRRRYVEPVSIVDKDEYGSSLCELRNQLQDCNRDEKAIIPGPLPETERATQCALLRRGKRVQITESRPDELVQRGERELGLGFHSTCTEHVHVCRTLARVIEQGRLPDAGLAAENEDAASGRTRPVEQRSDQSPLIIPPVEHPPIVRLTGTSFRV